MKKILFAILAFSSTSLFAQKKADDIAKLDVETYDFGKIKQNTDHLPEHKANKTFIVTNIGKEDLMIEQATPGCQCTVSEYTKTPIAPGKTGFIKASYNAENPGHFDKTLTVKFAGADDVKYIKLTGDVLDAAAYDKAMADQGAKAKPAAASSKKEKKAEASSKS